MTPLKDLHTGFMARVALEAEAGLEAARSAALRAHRDVQGAMQKAGSARNLLAQSKQELLGLPLQGPQGSQGSQSSHGPAQGAMVLEIPQWLQLDALMSMRQQGLCWQEVLRNLGLGPGLQLGERPIHLGQHIPDHLLDKLETAFALQQGVPLQLNLPRVPDAQPGSQVEEADSPQSMDHSGSQAQPGQDSESTQERSCTSKVVFKMG